jgi:hypothetical protein
MSDQTQDKLWSDEAIGRTVREYCSYRVADTILCMSQGAAHSLLTEIRDDYEQRLAAVSAERDELQASFDLRWNADMKAIARWQESTGRELVWPDHADLCVWLMQEIKRVGAERDELRQQLAALEQAGTWEPVPDGTYSADKLLVHVLAGRYVIATKATHDDTGQDYWNATSLPNDYRLCRTRPATRQEGGDGASK